MGSDRPGTDQVPGLIVPENVVDDNPRYAPGAWDYPKRCADVDRALSYARETIEEWDREKDPHGWWHNRSVLIALHNEVLRLRRLVVPIAERSTPEGFEDCADVMDVRGKRWRYSEPSDTWALMDEETLMVAPHSHRSWQRLYHEFGPLDRNVTGDPLWTPEPGDEVPEEWREAAAAAAAEWRKAVERNLPGETGYFPVWRDPDPPAYRHIKCGQVVEFADLDSHKCGR